MTAQLKKFRVTNFRSIKDSGWIEVDDVAALIGTNESGKTNLLTALWKLKPAKGGSINLIEDLPRKRYHSLRNAVPAPLFIDAEFELDDTAVSDICTTTNCLPDEVRIVRVSRRFRDKPVIQFPEEQTNPSVETDALLGILDTLSNDVDDANELRGERGLERKITTTIPAIREDLPPGRQVERPVLEQAVAKLQSLRPKRLLKTSTLAAALHKSINSFKRAIATINRACPSRYQNARNIAWDAIPPFVYYSQYGNLDSEIYLPHVIENLERDDLGAKDRARARTLKVLFKICKIESPRNPCTWAGGFSGGISFR